jgi:uncharacterized protein YndB with AHSA1/START domain
VPTDPDRLLVTARYPDCPPGALYDHWTVPALLTRWWPQAAETDPRPGGTYHLAWPLPDWHLRGAFTAVEPGATLAFTWRWDHEPENMPTRQVVVTFEPLPGGGTWLFVAHGRYGATPAEVDARAGHLAGWTHFLARLQDLTCARAA